MRLKSVTGIALVSLIALILGCTTTGDIYTREKGQKIDPARTIGLGLGALIIYEASKGGSGAAPSRSVACTGPYCAYSAAWDYLPGSNQWRCRDTGGQNGGQFVNNANCAGQTLVDNWQ